MFKKFKDKLAEEMKQSPSRLQAGMQQLAQAVISPAASNNLIGDIGTSVEDLDRTSEEAETLGDSSATSQFQNIDLQAPNSMERSRRSSFSSVTSDNFFPTYESPGSLYHIQSDMEQSASEFEDNSSSQLDRVSKEDLYTSYKKLRTKYSKYRAVYRELYKENMKMKSVLVETQDKALRRIANLKEQCQLEQEAKAHLEEALRNDIEEKDHLINTLTTKINLLRSNGSSGEPSSGEGEGGGGAIDLLTGPEDNLVSENAALKEKVKRFETLLAKCNESLKRNKEKISQLTENRDILERDLNVMKNSNEERTEMLESEVYKAKREILSLSEQIEVLKKREEDSALSLAENKLFIHRELEVKEEQNKQLQQELRKLTEYKDILAEAVVKYDREFKQFEVLITDQRNATDLDKKFSQLQEMFASKSEALKLIQQDVKQKFIGTDDETRSNKESGKEKKEPSASESVARNEEQMNRSRDELEIQNAQLLGLRTELKSSKSTINDLKEMLREVTMDWEQVKREKECLIANILEYKRILGILRRDCGVLKSEIKENFSEEEETLRKEIAALTTKVFAAFSQRRKEEEEEESSRNVEASGVELKTIINENNALRKKCEELLERNEEMLSKANEFDEVKTRNVRLIAEIDELNFKLRDVSELQETQEKLESEMEGLRGRFPLDKNLPGLNNEDLSKEVSSLKEKVGQYDILSKENAVLKQELIELKNELSSALNNAEEARCEQSRNAELGVENFSKKCSEYEAAIVNLTEKFSEQTNQLEKLNEELAKQKNNFSELSEKYEIRNSEFKETNDALVKQTLELKELNEKYVKQCTEIEDLRSRETEILRQLDETVKARQEMLAKLGELEAGNVGMEELKSRHDEAIGKLESLETMNAQLAEEIESLKSHGEAQNLRIEELRVSNVDIARSNKELKEERNNLSKLNTELNESQRNFEEENERLKESVTALRENVESLKEKLDSETRVSSDERNELENLKTKLRDFEKRNAELGERLAVLESQESRQKELKNEVESCNSVLIAQVGELQTKLAELETVRNANEELEKKVRSTSSKIEELENVETKNAELVEEMGELNGKLNDFETENQELKKRIEDLKSNVSDLEIQKSENVELSSKIRDLRNAESENVELAKEIGDLKAKLNDFETENQELKKRIEDLKSNVSNLEDLEKRNVDLVSQFESLRVSLEQKEAELRSQESRNSDLLLELERRNSDESRALEEKSKAIAELEKAAKDSTKKFSDEVEALKTAKKDLQEQLMQRSLKITELEKAMKDYTNKMAEHRREVEALTAENEGLKNRLVEVNADHSKALEDKSKVITELEKAAKDFENRATGLREEIETLEGANKNLREDLMRNDESKNMDEDLRKENKELSAKLDEALLLRESKESQMDILTEEMKNETRKLSEKLKTNEEEQSMRIKQLVKEFQAQIHDKDEQIRAALEKRFERQQNYESELIQQYKEQLKDFQIELTAKSEQIERLILDNKETIQAYKDQIEELTETITEIKKEHATELQSVEHNWKSVLKQRTDQMENKHVDEVNELTKEWWNERKDAVNSDTSPAGELESTSRVAMATIQSNTGSLHSLQQTLISQKRELSELRKLLRIRNDSLESSTEIEYLRNILFEYMMGRETLVLSKVISAVVKFDQEQTTKVLKKEEDKLTLLGSLGLL